MSPEQAEGDLEHLGPRSDVFSLGGTLYYLLTGRAPQEGDLHAVIRAVQRGEFVPPRQIDATIDRGLEAVCLKAMASRPEDRYATPRALADDVERWMADERVSAWSEPWTRTMLRWLTRHRTGVTGAAAAMLAGLVGLLAILVVQTQAKAEIARALSSETRANVALGRANAELGRSKAAVQARYELAVEAIQTFHTGVSEDFLLKEEGFKALRHRLLRSAGDFYGRLGAMLGTETDLPSRRALAASNFELARLTAKVGRQEEALAMHRAVLAAREALATEAGPDVALKIDVGRSANAVAGTLVAVGKMDEAAAVYRRAETLLKELAATEPAARAILAECRSRLGMLLGATDRTTEALVLLRQAQAEQDAPAAAPGATIAPREQMAITSTRLAIVLKIRGRLPEAVSESRRAIDLFRRLGDENPDKPEFRSSLAHTHTNLGSFLGDAGRLDEAEAEFRTALAIHRKAVEDYPAVTMFRSKLAQSYGNLGVLFRETGRNADAEAAYREAISIQRKLAVDNPAVPEFRVHLGYSLGNLGQMLEQLGRQRDAEAEFLEAAAVWNEMNGRGSNPAEAHAQLAISHYRVGMMRERIGERDEAIAAYREAARVDGDRVGNAIYAVGRLHVEAGHLDKAMETYQHAAEIDADDGRGQAGIATILIRSGRAGEAVAAGRHAVRLLEQKVEAQPDKLEYRDGLGLALVVLGDALRATGSPGPARDTYDRAIAMAELLSRDRLDFGSSNSRLGSCLRRRGLARAGMGDLAGAAADARRALGLYDGLPSRAGEEWYETACCHAALAGLAARGGAGLSPAEAAVETEATMGMMHKAIARGYRDMGGFRTEAALDPLRDREDFRLLMMDLVFPAEAFARPR
jgi:tetratricopeptide (TPR) repeat protein